MKASRVHVRWTQEDESVLLLREILSAWDADDEDSLCEVMGEVREFLGSREDGDVE